MATPTDSIISVQVSMNLKLLLIDLGRLHGRSRSDQIRTMLMEWLKDRQLDNLLQLEPYNREYVRREAKKCRAPVGPVPADAPSGDDAGDDAAGGG